MQDGVDLVTELFYAMDMAKECIDDMHSLGEKKADAERSYRIQKQKRMLFERDQNHTPVSIIADIVKGYQDIADADYKRELAQTDYDANYEAILFWKKRADMLREMIAREWSRAGEVA